MVGHLCHEMLSSSKMASAAVGGGAHMSTVLEPIRLTGCHMLSMFVEPGVMPWPTVYHSMGMRGWRIRPGDH
jgi:hypothetical protein